MYLAWVTDHEYLISRGGRIGMRRDVTMIRVVALALALGAGSAAVAAEPWRVPVRFSGERMAPSAMSMKAPPSLDRQPLLPSTPWRPVPLPRLDRQRLMSRVALPLETISAFHQANLLDRSASDTVMSTEMSDEVRRGVEYTTRRALKDYLLEQTTLVHRVELWADRKRPGGGGSVGGDGSARRMSFNAGFDGFAPEVEMRYAVPYGAFRVSVDAGGELSVRYRVSENSRAELGAGVDGHGAYNLGVRIGF
jgi:hypothetical protein